MIELPLEYWNELAKQIVFLSALLGGFSLAVIVSLLSLDSTKKEVGRLFRASIVSAASFLIALFSMTNIIMLTTEGYPFPVVSEDLGFPRIIGFLFFITGLVSMFAMVALSGWVKSKKMGRFTVIIAGISLFLVLALMVGVRIS